MSDVLFQAFVYLCAAVVAVPIARRLGLGSVLGYLIAGVVIGPAVGLVNHSEDLLHVAEFGVVMMLFLIGLELDPDSLWRMRRRLLGLGGLQTLGTLALAAGVAAACGLAWRESVAVGMILALSSTAIVLQTLSEKGLMKSPGGRSSFAVLLFQDIAVIPMLALMPLLAAPHFLGIAQTPGDAHGGADARHEGAHHGMSLVADLPGWAVALSTLAAVAFVVVVGLFLARPMFRYIAEARLREIFTAAALLLVIGIALLMTLVGLSPALGTFLAGVILANSEFRHELESNIEPFKGLLLGLFFITVGAGIDFGVLAEDAQLILGLTLGVIALKAAVLLALAKMFHLKGRDQWLFALGLAQAGEFGFVLLSFAQTNAVLGGAMADRLSLVVALSMLATPAMFIFYEHVVARKFRSSGPVREHDSIDEKGSAIIAGHGRFGMIVNRMLLSNGFKTVVLDHQTSLVDGLRRFDVRVFYGDATRPELLHAAGLQDAKLLVAAIKNPEAALRMVAYARRERPDLHIIARAVDRHQVYALYEAGANDVIREVFDSSIRAGRCALEALGRHPYEAEKAAQTYVAHDSETLGQLAAVWDPAVSVFENKEYIRIAKERTGQMAAAMRGDRDALHMRSEHSWAAPPPDTSLADAADLEAGEAETEEEDVTAILEEQARV